MESPNSNIILKPTVHEVKSKKRKIEKRVRDAIKHEKQEQASDFVLQNRMSWKTYDRLRKAEGLTTNVKRPAQNSINSEPHTKRRRHGNIPSTLDIDKEGLLEEAKTWPPNKHVNWSQLA